MHIRAMLAHDSHAVAMAHTLSWQHAYKGIIAQTFLDSIDLKKRETNWRSEIEKNDPPLIRLVCEANLKVVAFACGLDNRTRGLLPDCDSELWAIYSLPSEIGKGYGKRLLDEFKFKLKSLGKRRFCVWVLKDNSIGRRFYERHGGNLCPISKIVKIGDQEFAEVAYEFDLDWI